MVHYFEFYAVKKLTPAQIANNSDPENPPMEPATIQAFFKTHTSRNSKVGDLIKQDLKEKLGWDPSELENLMARKLTSEEVNRINKSNRSVKK